MKKRVTLICPSCRYGDDYYVDEDKISISSPGNPYKVKCHHCREEWSIFQIVEKEYIDHLLSKQDFNTEIMGELPEE